MGYFDVVTGYQSWSDYISSQQQIRGFDQALQRQTKSLQVSLGNPKDRQRALEKGLGAIEGAISGGMGQVADNLEFGFDRLGSGIDQLNADFNLLMGDVIWKLEAQSSMLASILHTLQSPLDTQAKELRHRAEDAYWNGWYVEALADFLESEKKNYQDFAVHRSIGNIYLYHLIDLPKALEYFQKAAKYARPRDARQTAEALYFVAVVHGLQHELEAALDNMIEVTELNPRFSDAFYLQANFAGLRQLPALSVRSLKNAIQLDPRYHERAKGDPTFGSAKTAVNELLQELLAEVKAQAAKAQQSILSLKGQHQPLLAEGKASIERRIAQADEQYRTAKTYSDFVTFLKLPESITLELRVAEKQFQTKMQSDAALAASKRAQKERAEESARKTAGSYFRTALILAVVSYPIVGLVGCFVRFASWQPGSGEDHGAAGLKSWTSEALLIPLAIIVIGVIAAVAAVWRSEE